jgi:hypothetical protein
VVTTVVVKVEFVTGVLILVIAVLLVENVVSGLAVAVVAPATDVSVVEPAEFDVNVVPAGMLVAAAILVSISAVVVTDLDVKIEVPIVLEVALDS